MTKKKQSKRSAKQGAKKTSGSGVAPTLHEIPAMELPQASQDAQALSAPEPIVTEPMAPDLAAEPSSNTSIVAAATNELASAPAIPAPAPAPSPSPSITNDIPTPPPVAAALQEPGQSQKTTYDIEALETAQIAAPAPDLAATPNPPLNNSPSLNPHSLGSLTRSKSSSEVSRALPGKEEAAPKWRPPVDYFGASASAFSSSFSGNRNRDPDTIKRPGDSPQEPAGSAAAGSTPSASSPPTNAQNPPAQPSEPVVVYEPATDTSALSPKMAKFVSSLRERELTASGVSSPVLPQMDATSVDIEAIPQPQPPAAPPARDLTPMAKMPSQEGPRPEPKAFGDELPLAPKSSSQVAELRESIISQRAEGKTEDWHPVAGKKSPRPADPQISAELEHLKKPEQIKSKPEADRHLSLEEMAALDPDLALPTQTPQQQSIRRLKSKTTGGIHAEIYIPIYIVCLGLSWVTEQSAASGTCRDAGQRIETALQLLAPKSLADNFVAGLNVYDEREIKLHPFNPNKRPNVVQAILGRILAFCSGLSSAFGRIPATIAASTATNPLAGMMILLSYSSILILSLLIFFKFKRSTNWSIADFILLPIGLAAGSTLITAVLIAVLSMSASLAASYLPNTIILYTTVAVVLAVLDMARRSFLGRKQAIVRD
ncbi:hypothetical protein BH10CYA1_BH10CYA1_18940 [soil metagenome]